MIGVHFHHDTNEKFETSNTLYDRAKNEEEDGEEGHEQQGDKDSSDEE